MRDWKNLAAMAASMLALTAAAAAQTPAPQGAEAQATAVQTFEPAFFARFNPITALDMVRQLPGFTIDEGAELRGFGATAGNVLVNGQRPTTKTSISDELGRIAARDILRIELIGAAAASDIDVRGYTELANVVLKPASQTQVSTTWAATTRYQEQGRQGYQVGATRSWKTDDFGFRLNVQGTGLGEREEVDVLFTSAGGAPLLEVEEFYQNQGHELLVTGATNWTPTARDTLNMNFRVLPRYLSVAAAADVRVPAGAPIGLISLDYEEKDIWYLDLGGDWEHKFSAQNAVKLIAVNRLVNWRPHQLLLQDLPTLLTGLPVQVVQIRDNSDNRAGEHVVRGLWTVKPNASHTIEFGLEGAYNYRRVERTRQISLANGPFVPGSVPIASTKVEEERAEASITDVWRASPQFTLEAGFNYEISTISQSGDAVNERDFTYPKPRLVATWTPNAKDQYRLSLIRDVSQLDFGDFATGLDSIATDALVGNPNLKPEQTWKASVQWKRPIGQRGSISITGFYDDIEDTQDFIGVAVACPSLANPAAMCTAVGNIGDGERWGGRVEATLQLDAVGVKNGLLKFNVGAQDSNVVDPLTGQGREISNETEYDWSIDFRQDIPSMKIAWGGNFASALPVAAGSAVVAPPTALYRADRIETHDQDEGDLDLFIETTRFLGGALVRLTAANLFDAERDVQRQFFAPVIENRASTFGRSLTLTVAGAF